MEYKHASRQSPALDLLGTKLKVLYWKFIQILTPAMPPICLTRWKNQYNIDKKHLAIDIYNPFKVCRETCLQSFQYRIIHIILPCNTWLYVRKVVNTNNCQYVYCTNNNLDGISHYLVTCPPVSIHWESCVNWWKCLKCPKLNPLAEDNIILGFPVETNEEIILNYCLIVAKHYIYIVLKKIKTC